MDDIDMECRQCGAEITAGQNYCGACGQRLYNVCSGCNTSNPPFFKYCGQCGRNMGDVGTLLLDRAGLIKQADGAALDLLVVQKGSAIGKPFSLFVNARDLVLFYSHWNELIRSSRSQSLEIELNAGPDTTIHAQLALNQISDQDGKVTQIQMELEDISDRRQIRQELQEKQDHFDLIAYLADLFHPANMGLRRKTIGGGLEKISLIAGGQYGFIIRIDQEEKLAVSEFIWPAPAERQAGEGVTALSIAQLGPIWTKLLKSKSYAVPDFDSLPPMERDIWQTWHHRHIGSILAEMIYLGKQPVGIIGITRTRPGLWPRSTLLLVRLAGQLMAQTLPQARSGSSVIRLSPDADSSPGTEKISVSERIDVEDFEIEIDETEGEQNDTDSPERMQVLASGDDGTDNGMPLSATDDGSYQLKCPRCDKRESISLEVFQELGWVLKVKCPCTCTFNIIREMRHTYRKDVHLEGFFAQEIYGINKVATASAWGPMEVTNISKNGVNFITKKAQGLQVGDMVHLRFYLDNSSKTLIKKSAEVKSVRKSNVGCQFKGTDRHDVTLGFYFL